MRTNHKPLSVLIAAAIAATVSAQWSDDSAQNLAIGDRSGSQAQPKINITSDGGCYISWFDNSGGGYDVYLQRLNAAGEEQWAHNGVLVADRSFSSTQDYGLDVDGTGNALLIFRDDRSGSDQITAAKVTPDGTLAWGADGIQLTTGGGFLASPCIAATTEGLIVAAWISEYDVEVQQLDADGHPLWDPGVTLSDTQGGSFGLADLHASDDGAVIISWVRGGSMYWDPRHLWAQKLSSAGDPLWDATHVRVYDGGSLQMGNYPPFVPDGHGGAAFCWYSSSPTLQVFAQRILTDGTEAFGHNGAPVSTGAENRVTPDVTFDPVAEETFVFWIEHTVGGQSQDGVHGQKFNAAGARQWGDAGRTIAAVNDLDRMQVRTEAYDGGAMVFYVEATEYANEKVHAARVDTDGALTWDPPIIAASSVASTKGYLDTAFSPAAGAILAWKDGRSDDGDIYAQNINPDGSLGTPSNPADVTGDGVVDVLDLLAVLSAWGPCPGCPEDINDDDVVDVLDLLLVLSGWD